MKRIGYLLMAFFILASLAGCCVESRGVTTHVPGKYKGAKDPLLALKNQQALNDRLKLVQSDR